MVEVSVMLGFCLAREDDARWLWSVTFRSPGEVLCKAADFHIKLLSLL